MCALGQVSRVGFYRSLRTKPAEDLDVALRDAIQRIALEFPSYGWPRMTRELVRRGWVVNHKRVYRLTREDNLLCLRRRARGYALAKRLEVGAEGELQIALAAAGTAAAFG